MRIVFLCDAPYIHARRWVGHFVSRGDECHVISFRDAEIAGAVVHHVGGAEVLGKARYLLHRKRVARLVRELEPDLLHALHLTSYGFLGALSGFHPFVLTPEGTDILEAPGLTPLHRWLTRYTLQHADAVTATGPHLATETTRLMPEGKPVTVVPYGVDTVMFQPAAARLPPTRTLTPEGRGRSGRESRDEVVIGTATRFSVEKGVRYLVEAFAQVKQAAEVPVQLRLAGAGPEESSLRKLAARLGVAESVSFEGWVEHEALPTFLGDLDVFAMPSVYEGFGVAAVEAASCGLPVVASNVYGIPDVVRNGVTGLLVPSKDPQVLANALVRLVEDASMREKLGQAGRDFVCSRYNWQDNARQMELIYENVLHRTQQEVVA